MRGLCLIAVLCFAAISLSACAKHDPQPGAVIMQAS